MRVFLALGIGFLLYGCSAKHPFTGKYTSKNGPHYIHLKKDSSFIYEYRMFHLYERSLGRWETVNEKLIKLNSNIKNIDIPLNVTNLSTQDKDTNNEISLHLNIKGSNKLSDYKCRIYVNDEIFETRRGDSLSNILVDKPIKNFYFHILKEPEIVTPTYIAPPLITEKYVLENPKGNKLKIVMETEDSYFYYKVFNENPVKVKKDRIEIFNPYGRKWERLVKVLDDAKIFSSYLEE